MRAEKNETEVRDTKFNGIKFRQIFASIFRFALHSFPFTFQSNDARGA